MIGQAQAKRRLLQSVLLYVIADSTPEVMPIEKFIGEAIDGGAGMIQLREKRLGDGALLDAARRCAKLCRSRGIPFIVNDRVDIALASEADGVHVGQDDLSVETVRQLLGERAIVGLSTHSPEQIDRAAHTSADYIGVGPIHQTPTKEGRPAVGVQLVTYAARHAAQPFFAIGGLEPGNVSDVVAAGGTAISVLRWVSASPDPRLAAQQMCDALKRSRPLLGSSPSGDL